jgi:hypothetical protein
MENSQLSRNSSIMAGLTIVGHAPPQARSPFAQELEGTMLLKVVLAVGVDSRMLANHGAEWRSAGFIVLPVSTLREAFEHFRTGDFDLVLLGHALSVESKERLTYLIRSSGSHTPVISIADSSDNCDQFANATIENDPGALLQGMGDLLAEQSTRIWCGSPCLEQRKQHRN